jgi:hypothetical protein
MGSFHAQLAKTLLAALEQEQPQGAVVKAVALKTRELLDQLGGLVAEGGLAAIRSQGLPPVMERFCLNGLWRKCVCWWGVTVAHVLWM